MSNTKHTSRTNDKSCRGRPSIYSNELADQICLRIAAGDSVRKICSQSDMPNEETIYRWALNREEFSKKYRIAREIQQERHLDELLEIADQPMPLTAHGSIDSGAVQHARLRIDTRKWVMSRLAPKKYGNVIDMSCGISPENPLRDLLKRLTGTTLPIAQGLPIDTKDINSPSSKST